MALVTINYKGGGTDSADDLDSLDEVLADPEVASVFIDATAHRATTPRRDASGQVNTADSSDEAAEDAERTSEEEAKFAGVAEEPEAEPEQAVDEDDD